LTRGASAWLTALPTIRQYRMPNEDFQLATRHRLGLLPYDNMLGGSCHQRSCNGVTKSFHIDPDHGQSCKSTTRTIATVRHNDLRNELCRLGNQASFTCMREPNHHERRESVKAEGAMGWDEHGDILMIKDGQMIYVDVAVTRPTAGRMQRRNAITMRPLLAAGEIEDTKRRAYKEIAEVNGYTLLPAVFETYGGIAKDGRKLLRLLAAQAGESQAAQSAFLTHAYRALSVRLQRGNANISKVYSQMLRTADAAKRLLPAAYQKRSLHARLQSAA
jgi:hypothetical protein